MKSALQRNYNSQLLCLSSLIYLFIGITTLGKNPCLTVLLFTVTTLSVLHHAYFRNIYLTTLDWIFGVTLWIYSFYIFTLKFDWWVLLLIVLLFTFRVLDETVFKKKRYKVFNYTHSFWHVISALTILIVFIRSLH